MLNQKKVGHFSYLLKIKFDATYAL